MMHGPINIRFTDYFIYNNRNKLASILTTFTLLHTVNIAIRTQNNSSTVIDNIFVDNSRENVSSIPRTIIGLSYHDAKILTIYTTVNKFPLKQRTKLIYN